MEQARRRQRNVAEVSRTRGRMRRHRKQGRRWPLRTAHTPPGRSL